MARHADQAPSNLLPLRKPDRPARRSACRAPARRSPGLLLALPQAGENGAGPDRDRLVPVRDLGPRTLCFRRLAGGLDSEKQPRFLFRGPRHGTPLHGGLRAPRASTYRAVRARYNGPGALTRPNQPGPLAHPPLRAPPEPLLFSERLRRPYRSEGNADQRAAPRDRRLAGRCRALPPRLPDRYGRPFRRSRLA